MNRFSQSTPRAPAGTDHPALITTYTHAVWYRLKNTSTFAQCDGNDDAVVDDNWRDRAMPTRLPLDIKVLTLNPFSDSAVNP